MLNFKNWLISEQTNLNSYIKGGKVTLYHYISTGKGSDTMVLDPEKFGEHGYSKREMRASSIKRLFFYVDLADRENFFNDYNALYSVVVPAMYVYDLNADSKGYIEEERAKNNGALNIDNLLNRIIKEGYKGVFYESGGIDIVSWFEPIKVKNCS